MKCKSISSIIPPTARWMTFFLLALLVIATLLSPMTAAAEGNQGGVVDALKTLAKGFITFLIAVAALILAVGIATGFMTGMIESVAGRPGGLSGTWMRLGGIVVCFIGAVLTIIIANSIIDSMTGFTGGDITLPK
ncbi:hypothetical protein FBQ82_00710 [Anaerolineae bacterium CFX7]|nr:hypothetical protein [Anaerolineae bacterium CFX7]